MKKAPTPPAWRKLPPLPFRFLNGTWLGAALAAAANLLPFVLIWVPVTAASMLTLLDGSYGVQAAQMAIAAACSKVQRPGGATGLAGTAAAIAITAALFFAEGASARTIAGSAIWATMTFLNWGHDFAYSPWFAHTLLDWSLTNYSDPPGELRGALDQMRTEKTVYCFHPHGIATIGFSCNGCWNHEFHKRASLPDGPPATPGGRSTYRGTMFLLAASLREPSAIFKVVCDLSGRYQSASKRWMLRYMREGRNVAIIPGGAEDATIMEYGKHRTAMKKRKGLIKYALQHGYALTPIYTFGETRTYCTFTGLLKLRLWINSFGVPAAIFFGAWWNPIFMRTDACCLSYVGAPLQLPLLPEPTPEQVDEWHSKYLAALQRVFEEHKAEAGEPEAVLEIW